MDFSFEIKIQSSVCILLFSGSILSSEDYGNTMEEIEHQLAEGQRKFIIDLKEVKHINSSGLNFMLRIFTSIRNNGGELLLIHPNKTVDTLFKISKLNTVFKFSADEQTAINQLNASEA